MPDDDNTELIDVQMCHDCAGKLLLTSVNVSNDEHHEYEGDEQNCQGDRSNGYDETADWQSADWHEDSWQ